MRAWLGVVVLVTGLAGRAAAQAQAPPQVTFTVGLDPVEQRNGARKPIVQLRNLITDERWARELDRSLPLIVSYQIETWRSRDGWIDDLVHTTSWQAVVSKQPLVDEYSVTLIIQAQPARPERFGVRDSAAAWLDRRQRVEIFPTGRGRFYYNATATITVLTDRDLDQLERFLAGDPTIDIPERPTQLGRGLRRLLLQIAGLPSQRLEAKSEEFDTRSPDQL